MKISDADFVRLRDFMYNKFGINLAQKRTLIEGRLNMTLSQRGYTDFGTYIDDVMRDVTGREVSLLVSKLTTNFTFFLREEGHYSFLTKNVFPLWKSDRLGESRKIWSAACSSGEEPYSLAMVASEFFKLQSSRIKIDASDISQHVLDAAKAGIYNTERISKLPPEWVMRYFVKRDEEEYEVKPGLKSMIQYKYFNLNDSMYWPSHTYDIIFCRNVMIYFDQVTRQALSQRLYNALKPGGYLIIGMSETLVSLNTEFKYVQPSIYKCEA